MINTSSNNNTQSNPRPLKWGLALLGALRNCSDKAHSTERFCIPSRIASTILAIALAFTLCAPMAFAEVLDTDVVYGKTVADRGLETSECPDISATSALVISQDGTVYFERNADEAVKIASLTKIMTAIVALENASLDSTVEVSAEAAAVGESSAGLLKGDSMTLEDALYALLVPSGNDAGIAIAESVGASLASDGQDAQEAFVEAMNAKAEEIGCTDTIFSNPHGLDNGDFESDAHSTARDVGIMVAYAMQNETFRSIVAGGSTTITVTSANGISRVVELITTDELIDVYEGMCGVKTGTTTYAGCCFAGACVRDEGEFYTVVLGAPTSEDRFTDTTILLDWVYGNLEEVSLISTSSTVEYLGEDYPLVAEVAQTDWPASTVSATVADPALSVLIFSLGDSVQQEVTFETLEGDIAAGDVVGHITFTQEGETVAECDLIAAQDAPAPNFFQSIGVWWDRLFRNIQGLSTVADSVCYNQIVVLLDR